MARGSRHYPWIGPAAVAVVALAVPAQASHTSPIDCAGTPITAYQERDFLGRRFIFGTPGNDVIAGSIGDDVVYGYEGDDLICGYSGRDRVYGMDGVDEIYGQEGRDRISGGDGADILDTGDGRDVCVQEAGEGPAVDCETRLETPFYEIDRLLELLHPRP